MVGRYVLTKYLGRSKMAEKRHLWTFPNEEKSLQFNHKIFDVFIQNQEISHIYSTKSF